MHAQYLVTRNGITLVFWTARFEDLCTATEHPFGIGIVTRMLCIALRRARAATNLAFLYLLEGTSQALDAAAKHTDLALQTDRWVQLSRGRFERRGVGIGRWQDQYPYSYTCMDRKISETWNG